ncbi:MAG TPA: hypothetical protein VEA44_10890 [Caulobacter sp.]|nr:hypothetical protein [Caulobacter sp.]
MFEPDTEPLDPEQALAHSVRRLSNGAKFETVRADLVARGTPPDAASATAYQALVLKTDAFRKQGWQWFGIGGAVFAVGAALIAAVAADGGVLTAYGATFGGFLLGARGLWQVLTNRPPGRMPLSGTSRGA